MYVIYKDLFNKYICVGGFPKTVSTYIETKNIMESIRVVQNTLFDIKTDFGEKSVKRWEPTI